MTLVIDKNIIAFDQHWQEPAHTEYSAYISIKRLILENSLSIYIAFPWATYIDLIRKNDSRDPDKYKEIDNAYRAMIEHMRAERSKGKNIVSTCQHIHACEHAHLFQDLHITDLFWSHKTISQDSFEEVKLHPYPLFPVHSSKKIVTETNAIDEFYKFEQRKYLCSFVGLTKHPGYPNDLRQRIVSTLCNKEDVLVRSRDKWHFQDEVYKKQINGIDQKNSYRNISNEDEYTSTLENSIFSFCPAGTGPNSIRLWESISLLSIPIILSDNLDLGNDNIDLWRSACVIEKEESNIEDLYKSLKRIYEDKRLLKDKFNSLRQLKFLYTSRCISQSLIAFFFNPLKTNKVSEEWSNSEANFYLKLSKEVNKNHSLSRSLQFDHVKSNRTPFGYAQLHSYYRSIFIPNFRNYGGSIYVSGIATKESHEEYTLTGSEKYFHLSEEPLWDLLYNSKVDGNYEYQGYCNNFFRELRIPYFLLTDTKYIERYNLILSYILDNFNAEDVLSEWSRRKYKFAAVCEYRGAPEWGRISTDAFPSCKPMCIERTALVEELLHLLPNNVYVSGKGWHGQNSPRQKLPDWHLDKLSNTPSPILFNAIENAVTPTYITEKPFDALCFMSLPVVCWPDNHIGHTYFEPDSFLNLHDSKARDWPSIVSNFQPNKKNASALLSSINAIYETISNPALVHSTRVALFKKLAKRISKAAGNY